MEKSTPEIDVLMSISNTPNWPFVPSRNRLPNLRASSEGKRTGRLEIVLRCAKTAKNQLKWEARARDRWRKGSNEEVQHRTHGFLEIVGLPKEAQSDS